MTAPKSKEKNPQEETTQQTKPEVKKICGIVMPIAPMLPDYTDGHWREVLRIIEEAAKLAGYQARLVSDSESINVIQKDIVQNLYTDEIIVCDVSGRNPNVLFELGMRLTFDKPTIIIKDDKTNYIFDIGIIKHLEYPKDLNYHRINEFKNDLADKIKGTIKAYDDKNFTTFLKYFKDIEIKPARLEKEEISQSEAVLNSLTSIQNRLERIERGETEKYNLSNFEITKGIDFSIDSKGNEANKYNVFENYLINKSDHEIKYLRESSNSGFDYFFIESFNGITLQSLSSKNKDNLIKLYLRYFSRECKKRGIAPF